MYRISTTELSRIGRCDHTAIVTTRLGIIDLLICVFTERQHKTGQFVPFCQDHGLGYRLRRLRIANEEYIGVGT